MTSAFLKLLTATAAAAFLIATPAAAQTNGTDAGAEAGAEAGTEGGGGGAEVVASQDLDARVNPNKAMIGETFRGLELAPAATVAFDPTIGTAVPETVVLAPVPPEIIAVSPETEGYEYFTLPDGKIVLVHPEERVVATIIE